MSIQLKGDQALWFLRQVIAEGGLDAHSATERQCLSI